MGWFKDAVKSVVKYNPITISTDLVTGGKASEMLGLEGGSLPGVTDIIDDMTGKTGADAAAAASDAAASAELQKLNYLKQINKLPQEYKEKALTQLASVFGLDGSTGGQQALIDQAKASPMYSAIMGGLQSGEESILRQAGQTGGLRSGNVQGALADYSTQLSNRALSESYNQQLSGLTGLAGLGTNESAIANSISNMGNIQAQGITGAAQAQTQGTQNIINTLLGGLGLFI